MPIFRVDSMFTNKAASESKGMIYQSGQLLPILAAGQLLAKRQHQFYQDQCRDLAKLSVSDFDITYDHLIKQFAEYVQLIPREWNETLGSLLNLSLERAMRCLYHFGEEYLDAMAIDRFAMFSAALLKNLASIAINQKIYVTDDHGKMLLSWQPLKGPLTQQEQGEFYRLLPLSNQMQRMSRSVTLLLARQVMGDTAFLWIAEFPQLFAEWLALLEGDESGGGRFQKILQLYEWPAENSPKINLPHYDVPEHAAQTQYGDQFLEWLREMLEKGEINVNQQDSNLFVTEKGVFVDQALFKIFVERFHLSVSPAEVRVQFANILGLTKEGLHHQVEQRQGVEHAGDTGIRKQNFLGHEIKMQTRLREGALMNDPALLFGGPIPDMVTFIRHSVHMQASAQRAPILSSMQLKTQNTLNK